MTYRGLCCGVTVIGRLVWIALGVLKAEERCPACGKWATFVPEVEASRKKAA